MNNNNFINPHALIVFIIGFSTLSAGLFVYFKNRSSRINLAFLYICISAGIWLLANAFGYQCAGKKAALAWFKISNAGFMFIAVNVYFFVTAFLGLDKKKIINAGYALALIFSVLALATNMLINDVLRASWGPSPKWGILGIPTVALFLTFMAISLFSLFVYHKKSTSSLKKNQIRYIFMAFLWACVAFVDYLSVFGANIYPFGYVSIAVFLSIVTYAIIKHRFLDVKVAITRTAILLILYSAIIGIPILFGFCAKPLLQRIFTSNWLFIPLGFYAVLTFFAPFAYLWLQEKADERMLERQRQTQLALRTSSKSMVELGDKDRLAKNIARYLTIFYQHRLQVKLKLVAVFLIDESINKYVLKAVAGETRSLKVNEFDKTNPFSQWFVDMRKPLLEKRLIKRKDIEILLLENIEAWLENKNTFKQVKSARPILNKIHSMMRSLKAQVCIASFYQERLIGFLLLGEKSQGIYTEDELETFLTMANDAAVAFRTAQLSEESNERVKQMVISLAKTVDAKDHYTANHMEDVTEYGKWITEELGIEFSDILKFSLQLHDIGKLGIPDSILNKTGKLTETEYQMMKRHPIIGAEILSPLTFFKDIGHITLCHQERYNSTGYPNGLKGEEIPLESRIIGVADAYHAMTSKRAYKSAWAPKDAAKELIRCKGGHFDPRVVNAFIKALIKKDVIKKEDIEDIFVISELEDLLRNDNSTASARHKKVQAKLQDK